MAASRSLGLFEKGGPKELIEQSLADLEELRSIDTTAKEANNADLLTRLTEHLTLAFHLLAASVGECQIETPYASVYLVRRPDGSREWCCGHDQQHCDPV